MHLSKARPLRPVKRLMDLHRWYLATWISHQLCQRHLCLLRNKRITWWAPITRVETSRPDLSVISNNSKDRVSHFWKRRRHICSGRMVNNTASTSGCPRRPQPIARRSSIILWTQARCQVDWLFKQVWMPRTTWARPRKQPIWGWVGLVVN